MNDEPREEFEAQERMRQHALETNLHTMVEAFRAWGLKPPSKAINGKDYFASVGSMVSIPIPEKDLIDFRRDRAFWDATIRNAVLEHISYLREGLRRRGFPRDGLTWTEAVDQETHEEEKPCLTLVKESDS